MIGLCIPPADEKIGPGDRWIVEQIRAVAPRTTLIAIVTKIDKVSKDQVAGQLMAVSELVGADTEIVPVSRPRVNNSTSSSTCSPRSCRRARVLP